MSPPAANANARPIITCPPRLAAYKEPPHMSKKQILVADPISTIGIEELQAVPEFQVDVKIGISPEDLLASADQYEAIVVRSQTKITADVFAKATKLKAVGRAGVGVDNIDVKAATQHGVIVMNTPGGNTISTAEHAFTLMVSLARHIPQAHASMQAGRWDRKKYEGVELNGKTLAVLGLGRIGAEFAKRAIAFGMKVVAYDPYLSPARAQTLRVELAESVDSAIAQADFITMHMPLTPETKHMLNATRIAQLKKGVRIINCARGGLVDEAAVAKGIADGIIAGAAFDVYEEEPPKEGFPLRDSPHVVLTPHLGASTQEAQENVGIEVARTIRDFLLSGAISNAVNMPNLDPATAEQIGRYLTFAERLGRVAAQIGPANPEVFRVDYSGKVSGYDTTLVTRSALVGFLRHRTDAHSVNHINAPGFAERQGLRVTESHHPTPTEFTDYVELNVRSSKGTARVAGTFFGNSPRIVRINEHRVEADPAGNLLLLTNEDIPGRVGQVGTLLGKHQVNIADMSLSRTAGGMALTVLNLDSPPSAEVLRELEALPGIHEARLLRL